MRTTKAAALILGAGVAFGLCAENATITWVGGSAAPANVADNWDPSDKGTPYTEPNKCDILITNSVMFTVGSASGEFWRNTKLTVTNGSTVVFGGRFWPSADTFLTGDKEVIVDVAADSVLKATYMTGGDVHHTKTFVKAGGGTFETLSIGTSGYFKNIRFLGGTATVGTYLHATNAIEVAAGALLQLKTHNAVNTNDCHALVTVDGVLDCGGKNIVLDGLEGSGVVVNASGGVTLTLLRQEQNVFTGCINGSLTVAPLENAPAGSCFVIGDAYSLTNAELTVVSTDAIEHPVKFAPGIGKFYVRAYPVDRTFYDTDGNVVTLERWAEHYYVDRSVESSGDGRSPETAYKTIQEALTAPDLVAETGLLKIVHVAEGVYDSGEMGDSLNLSRVVVPSDVWLVSDEGPEKTFIVGAASSQPPTGAQYGCGEGAVRCVSLEKGARIEGFTLTGGRTYLESTSSGKTGGGVYCPDKTGFVVDCVISNNAACRGGGGAGGTYIRSHIIGNMSENGNLGSGLYLGCDLYSCVINDNGGTCFYHAGNKSYIRNCIFGPDGTSVRADGETAKWCEVYNTVFMNNVIANSSAECSIALTNCIVMTTGASAASNIDADEDTVITNNFSSAAAKFAWLGLDENFRPLPPLNGPVVDRGNNAYYSVPAGEKRNADIAGNARFSGSSIDLGPYEADSSRTFVTVKADGSGVSVTGADKGTTEVPKGGSLTVVLEREFDSDVLCTGITVNGLYFDFDDYPDGWSTNVTQGSLADSLSIEAVYATNTVLWVDAAAGDDANKGYHESCPKRTLAGALDPAPPAGTVVYVAPGEYTDRVMSLGGGHLGEQLCRAIVPAGVTLESTGGAGVTFIGGEASPVCPADNCYGCGTGSVRCVSLAASTSVLRGFTLRDGRTVCVRRNSGYSGGGVYGSGVVEDCVFTNCVAVRGGGVSVATCRRCVFVDCGATEIGAAVNECKGVYNCVFGGCTNGTYITLYSLPVVNSTFLPHPDKHLVGSHYGDSGDYMATPSNFVNCAVFVNPKENQSVYANCAFASCFSVADDMIGEGSFIIQAERGEELNAAGMNADGSLRRGSPLVDAGSDLLYAAVSAGDADAALRQRVYNRVIDIGAREYDWRGDFARVFGRHGGFSVVEAGENVTTNATAGLKLSDRDTLGISWPDAAGETREYAFTVEVSGEGTLVYSVNGGEVVEVTAADGVKEAVVSGVTGDFGTEFSFTGSGSAAVYGFKRDGAGLLLIIK